MSYGDKALKNPGSTGRTPSGKSSWNEFVNEVRGNIRNALQSMSLSEYIELLVDVAGEEYGFYTPSWMLDTEIEEEDAFDKLDQELSERETQIREARRELGGSTYHPQNRDTQGSHPKDDGLSE